MTIHQFFNYIRRLTRVTSLSFLAVFILISNAPQPPVFSATKAVERIDKGEFYYSGGEEVPLVRHKDLFAVRFKDEGPALKEDSSADGAPISMKSVLKRNKGLKHSDKSGPYARYRIHLLEGLDEGNGEKHDGILRNLDVDPEVEFVQPVFLTGRDEPLVMSDIFIAKFVSDLSAGEIDAVNAMNGVEIVKPLEVDLNVFVLKVVEFKGRTTLDVANGYYRMDEVEWAHPDWIRRLEFRYTPNDPLYPDQWHLNNTGSNGAKADTDIDATEAWNITKGVEEIIVAVIDDGVETSHEDFAGRLVPGRNVGNDTDDPNPGKRDAHGTAVAGLVSANQDNGKGVSGVAPYCKIMPIRIPNTASTSDEAEAFLFATQNGASIITNSWGPPDGSNKPQPLPDVVRDAFDYATDNGRGGKGCVILFASGNGNESVDNDGYASYEKVIAVGATSDKDKRAPYSDYGSTLDIMAPSSGSRKDQGITTTDRIGTKGYSSNDYTHDFGGTSAACPIAAGVAALILSANDDLTRTEVQEILQSTAEKVSPNDADYNAGGFSQKYGYGRINAYEAVLKAMDQNPSLKVSIESPPGDVTINVGEAVNFAGKVIENGNVVVGYHWDFDGGAPDSLVEDPGPVTFNTPGTFNVTFKVTDDKGGESSDSVKVFVKESNGDEVSYTVDSTDTPVDIPDGKRAGVDSSVQADFGESIVSVNVSVNIAHTYIGDLVVSIKSPEGTKVKLHKRSGGSSNDLVTTYDTLTDPAQALDAFTGEDPRGTWTLNAADKLRRFKGTLNSWQLEVVAINGNTPSKPDLVPTKSKAKLTRKNKIKAVAVIKNQGSDEADAFEVDFLLSTDTQPDPGDISIETVEIAGLDPQESKKEIIKVDVPGSVGSGKYYLIVDADPDDSIGESNETNNNLASNNTISVP